MAIAPGAFPDTVSEEVRKALGQFYHLSNASSTHSVHTGDEDQFAALFSENGIYEFAGEKATGPENIKALREKLFQNIPHREHSVERVYTFGHSDRELKVLGSVRYKFHDGRDHETSWAGRMILEKDGLAQLKFRLVQIIINPAYDDERG